MRRCLLITSSTQHFRDVLAREIMQETIRKKAQILEREKLFAFIYKLHVYNYYKTYLL